VNDDAGLLPTPSRREKDPAELATSIAKVATKIQKKTERMLRKKKVHKVMKYYGDCRFSSLPGVLQ
jgi:hypothetical protein